MRIRVRWSVVCRRGMREGAESKQGARNRRLNTVDRTTRRRRVRNETLQLLLEDDRDDTNECDSDQLEEDFLAPDFVGEGGGRVGGGEGDEFADGNGGEVEGEGTEEEGDEEGGEGNAEDAGDDL